MVDHLQEKMGWNIHESKHEDTTVFSFDDGSFSYTFLNGHLIAVYSMNPVETDDVMLSILDRKSKEAAPWLGELLDMANHDWQMFAAINAREAVTVWSDLLATPEIAEALSEQAVNIDEVGGLALAFDVKPQSITFKAHVTYVENPELPANWYLAEKEDRIADEMPGDALASFRVALDWDKVMAQMEEKTSELKPEDLEQLGQSLGIENIRRDLLENLGSPTVITVVDGQGPETMELGGVLRIPVKDGQSLNLVLEQLAGSMNEHQEMVTQIQEGETLWYRMDMEGVDVNWAVHKDHLMVSVGEAITGLLQIPPAEGSSFLSTIKDVEIREHLRSKGDSVMYVNLAKTLDMFKEHMTDMPSEGRTLAMSLGGLHMVNETTEKSGTSTMVLTSREGTTFTGEILELIRSQP